RISSTHLSHTGTKASDRQDNHITNLAMSSLMTKVLVCDILIPRLDVEIRRVIEVPENSIGPGTRPGKLHNSLIHVSNLEDPSPFHSQRLLSNRCHHIAKNRMSRLRHNSPLTELKTARIPV